MLTCLLPEQTRSSYVCVGHSGSHRWKQDAFQHHWNDFSAYTFPTFVHLRQVLLRVMLLTNLSMVLVAPFWLQKQWLADLLAHRPVTPQEISERPGDFAASHLEVGNQLIHKAVFSEEVAEVVTSDLR